MFVAPLSFESRPAAPPSYISIPLFSSLPFCLNSLAGESSCAGVRGGHPTRNAEHPSRKPETPTRKPEHPTRKPENHTRKPENPTGHKRPLWNVPLARSNPASAERVPWYQPEKRPACTRGNLHRVPNWAGASLTTVARVAPVSGSWLA